MAPNRRPTPPPLPLKPQASGLGGSVRGAHYHSGRGDSGDEDGDMMFTELMAQARRSTSGPHSHGAGFLQHLSEQCSWGIREGEGDLQYSTASGAHFVSYAVPKTLLRCAQPLETLSVKHMGQPCRGR